MNLRAFNKIQKFIHNTKGNSHKENHAFLLFNCMSLISLEIQYIHITKQFP